MVSLFFWRSKRPDKPAAPATAAAAAPSTAPAAPVLPVRRMAHALALRDERAADPSARLDPAQTQLLLAASQEFSRVGTEPRYTPQRPSLLPQLLEVVHDEEASLRALSRIVAQDPQLTGELLRTANSPMYRASTTPVESVERAAALLGNSGMRTLIASALVKPLTQGGGSVGRFGEVVWEHALYSASAAEAWAARNQDADTFAAHLLALMYGLGSVAVFRVMADLYDAQPRLPRDPAAIATALDASATVTAARIAESWGLSERAREALEAQSSAAPVGDAPLTRALRFGLTAGAVTLLVRYGRITEEAALEQIAAAGFSGPVVERTWERLVKAYIRP
jgi:HD-like signal output (HDOD) protein